MKPISPVIPGNKYPEVVYAKFQPEYFPLPAYKTEEGIAITRWKLTWKERLQLLFQGHLYLSIITFNNMLQPVKLTIQCPFLPNEKEN
jgi:hypothetical protein